MKAESRHQNPRALKPGGRRLVTEQKTGGRCPIHFSV
jgi:hypothetical protein